MRTTILVLTCLLLTASLTIINAQPPQAQVQLNCLEESIALDAYPGAENNTILVHCQIGNPTSGEEKVEFNGSWDKLCKLNLLMGMNSLFLLAER